MQARLRRERAEWDREMEALCVQKQPEVVVRAWERVAVSARRAAGIL